MKKIILIILLNFSFIFLTAQTWVRQYPFAQHETLNDIDLDADGHGWAVGMNSIVLRTENGGDLWLPQNAGLKDWHFTAVEIVPGTNGIKGFSGGSVLFKTIDGGQSWEQVPNSVSNIVKILAINEDTIIVLGRYEAMRTIDGGENWEKFNVANNSISTGFFLDLLHGWVDSGGYNNSQVYYTSDGGQTWDLINSVKYPGINGFYFFDNNKGLMISRDWVHKTLDGGVTWDTLNPTTLPSTTDFHVVNEKEIWVGLNNGQYTHTQDSGKTWIQENTGVIGANKVGGIYAMDDGRVWIAGQLTSISYSNDRGETWEDQMPGQKNVIFDIDFYDKEFGIAVGNGGLLLRTTDGGSFWEDLTYNSEDYYRSVSVVDQNNIVVATYGKILISSDGGDNWIEKSAEEFDFTAIHARSVNEFIGCTNDAEVARTIDGGDTWEIEFDNGYSTFMDIDFPDPDTGFVVGRNGIIAKTVDGGNTWGKIAEDAISQYEDITMINSQIGWMNFTNSTDTLLYTNNGGDTWEKRSVLYNRFWSEVAFMNADTGWVAGGSSGHGTIMITTDGGNTWSHDYSGTLNFMCMQAPVPGNKIVWAGGMGGNILKFSPCQANPEISNLTGTLNPVIGDTIFYEVNATGVDIFNWSLPEGWIFWGNNNTAKPEVIVGKSSGQITVTGSNSCDDETGTLSMNVIPIYSTTENISICDGESYNELNETGIYTDTLVSVTGTDSIVTINLTVNPLYEITENIIICEGESHKGWSSEGQYTENLTSVSGCDSTVITNLSLFPSYQPVINIDGNTLSTPDQYQTYQWYKNDGTLLGSNITYTITESGDYYLIVTDENNCTNTSDIFNAIFTSINPLEFDEFKYSIIPNPNTGMFSFKFDSSPETRLTLKLVNANGQILEIRGVEPAVNHTELFDISHLSKGIYHLIISTNIFQKSEKIIVQ